jgi:putative endonuclease
MKGRENRDGRSESGPPEPWRRRAFSYAYVLRAFEEPNRIYVGWTNDLRERLNEHNWGMSPHAARHRPWEIVWYAGFSSEEAARAFVLSKERLPTRISPQALLERADPPQWRP